MSLWSWLKALSLLEICSNGWTKKFDGESATQTKTSKKSSLPALTGITGQGMMPPNKTLSWREEWDWAKLWAGIEGTVDVIGTGLLAVNGFLRLMVVRVRLKTALTSTANLSSFNTTPIQSEGRGSLNTDWYLSMTPTSKSPPGSSLTRS